MEPLFLLYNCMIKMEPTLFRYGYMKYSPVLINTS